MVYCFVSICFLLFLLVSFHFKVVCQPIEWWRNNFFEQKFHSKLTATPTFHAFEIFFFFFFFVAFCCFLLWFYLFMNPYFACVFVSYFFSDFLSVYNFLFFVLFICLFLFSSSAFLFFCWIVTAKMCLILPLLRFKSFGLGYRIHD